MQQHKNPQLQNNSLYPSMSVKNKGTTDVVHSKPMNKSTPSFIATQADMTHGWTMKQQMHCLYAYHGEHTHTSTATMGCCHDQLH